MYDTNIAKPVFTSYQPSEREEYMSDKQLQHFRQILLEWKKQLMADVNQTVHHLQDDVENYPDPNDRATQEQEITIELRTRDRERQLIKKIDRAIITIDTGEYGFCVSCGSEIGLRRLEARNTATKCIECKTQDEIREKRSG